MSGVAIRVLVFIIGLVLGIRLVAALYGALDLWYTIRTAWLVVLVRTGLWGGAVLVSLFLLNRDLRRVFLLGMALHVLMHVASWVLIVHSFPRRPSPTRVVE